MDKFLNFFQKNGLLKLLGAFILLALDVWLFNITDWNIFKYLIWVPGGYIIITWVVFMIAAVVGTINDHKTKKLGLFDKKGNVIKKEDKK